jgi:predicted glycosyltransferase
MKILANMGHPKDVNILKNIIWNLEEKGHMVKIFASNKENVFQKLDAYDFSYNYGKHYNGLIKKTFSIFENDFLLYKISKEFRPDIFIGSGSVSMAHVSKLLRKPYIAFIDVEGAKLAITLLRPFTDVILTPSCFYNNLGKKQVRFNSYFEFAYLHPNNFKPNPSVLKGLNLTDDDKYILMRISSLNAFHDIGAKGMNFNSSEELREFIQKLESYGHVFLTSEIKLSDEIDKYELKISINDLQSCISFATMYIGDGASMAAEAAILGVPSIYITNNTRRWGFIKDLEKNYGLLYTFSNREQALEKAIELLDDPNLKEKWQKKREKMLSEKIDAAKFITEFIEKHERK